MSATTLGTGRIGPETAQMGPPRSVAGPLRTGTARGSWAHCLRARQDLDGRDSLISVRFPLA
jgi:hypothetical protein